jgi:8-oxo-dGTP pyrophosphatase MutT (NUDIX family)
VSAADVEIVALSDVDARYEPAPGASAGKPQMFNGTVLMQHGWRIERGVLTAGYAPVSYASFIAWPQLGKPGPARRNGFAMAALRSSDGAFILGVMGPGTFNAGKIYFPAGTPDMSDVTPEGRVDLATSMVRELKEETGLRDGEFAIEQAWTLVVDGHRAAFMRAARLPWSAEDARGIIRARLAAETDQELSDVAIVRGPHDIDEAMTPVFAKAYMRAVFAAEG